MRRDLVDELVVEAVDRRAPRCAAPGRRSDARAQRGVAPRARRPRGRARLGSTLSGPRPRRSCRARPRSDSLRVRRLLRVDVDAERAPRGAPRSAATARTAASTSAIAARRSAALTTTCARSRPRRRNSGAGPERRHLEPLAHGRRGGGRRPRLAPTSRRSGSASRTAGSAAPRGGRARRRGSPRCRAARRGQRRRVGRDRLDEHAPVRAAAPGAARQLGDERERALLGAEVGEAQRRVGVEDDAERDVGEVVALGDHLRADEHPARRCLERGEHARAARGVSASSRKTGLAGAGELVLEPLGARAVARRSRPSRSASQRDGTGSRWPQWWQASGPVGAVQDERDVAVRAHPDARRSDRQERKFDQPRRLSSTMLLARVVQRVRGRAGAARAARSRMSTISTGGQPRAVDARRRAAAARSRVEALGPRRRAAGHEHGAGDPRPLGGDRAGVVARVALVLVGAVVLLVDDDQAEPLERREDRRARADADAGLAARAAASTRRGARRRRASSAGPRPCRRSARRSATTICGVSPISGTSTIAPPPARQRLADGAQVDLGLARAGDAVQQQLRRRAGGAIASSAARCSAVSSGALARPRRRRVRRRAADDARLDAHEPARLEPPQRRSVARRRSAAASASSSRWLSVEPLAPPAFARAARPTALSSPARPAGGSTSVSARAGVEQYSAAIHSASSTRSGGSECSSTRARRGQLVLGAVGEPGDDADAASGAPNGTSQQRADADALRAAGSRTARAARAPSSAARPWPPAASLEVTRGGSDQPNVGPARR